MPSKEEIEKKRTHAGGFLRKDLEEWGVSWPPPKGWKKRLELEHDLLHGHISEASGNGHTLEATVVKSNLVKTILSDALATSHFEPIHAFVMVEQALEIIETIG